jgi:hypothetical protein
VARLRVSVRVGLRNNRVRIGWCSFWKGGVAPRTDHAPNFRIQERLGARGLVALSLSQL